MASGKPAGDISEWGFLDNANNNDDDEDEYEEDEDFVTEEKVPNNTRQSPAKNTNKPPMNGKSPQTLPNVNSGTKLPNIGGTKLPAI